MNNENLEKILKLEEPLAALLNDQKQDNKGSLEKKVLKLQSLLEKADNEDLLYLLSYDSPIHQVVDVVEYFKPYEMDKDLLAQDKSYKEEFENLSSFVERIRYVSSHETEYLYICYKCQVDATAEFLLGKMTNEEIMELSNKSNDWDYKLFLYGNLKE